VVQLTAAGARRTLVIFWTNCRAPFDSWLRLQRNKQGAPGVLGVFKSAEVKNFIEEKPPAFIPAGFDS
jgi:hypothetical protein